jgi:imidazolonepropionase-like amidohydrolase
VASLETLQSLVKAAHELNLPVLMHANSSNAQRVGNQAGVDVLAHGLWNWSEPYRVVAPTPDVTQILDQVVADHRGYQPTIQVLYGERNLFDESLLSSPLMKKAVPAGLIAWYRSPEGQWFHDQLAKAMDLPAHPKPEIIDTSAIARVNAAVAYLAKRDAHFLFGSDTPSDETFANPPGLNGWWELHRLVEAGLSPAQLFKAATLANATTFGIGDEVGSVQVGKRANLLLLDEDPAVTVHAFDRIKLIILHGAVIDPATLAADAGKGPQ